MDELAARMSGGRKEQKNYKQVIEEIQGLGPEHAQRALSEELRERSTGAQALEGSEKWREAAVQYFHAALIAQAFSEPGDEALPQWFAKVSDCLVRLAEEYMTWGEADRGAAAIAVASLMPFLANDWSLKPFYTNFNNNHGGAIQQGKTASHSLWIPYDLANCVNNLDPEALERAESFSQTVLLTISKVVDPFRPAVEQALAKAREDMVAQMKVPNLQPSVSLPRDAVFGESFNLSVDLTNTGEGEAHGVTVEWSMPEGLQVEGGHLSTNLGTLGSNSQISTSLTLLSPSGEGSEEVAYEVTGRVLFLDVLNNQRQFPVGPYTIVVRAFKKEQELREALEETVLNHQEVVGRLTEVTPQLAASSNVVRGFQELYNTLRSEATSLIDEGKFDHAEARIELFRSFLQLLGQPTTELVLQHEGLANDVTTVQPEVSKGVSEALGKIGEAETLLEEFRKQWT